MSNPPTLSVSPEARNLVLRALAPIGAGDPAAGGTGHRFRISPSEMPVPPIVYWLLREFLGCPDLGPTEKVAWRLCLTIQGTPAGLSYEKFGMRLWIQRSVDVETAQKLRDRVVATLDKAVRAAEVRVLDPYFEEELARGHVIVRNQIGRLRGAYEYFRHLANDADAGARSRTEGASAEIRSDTPASDLHEFFTKFAAGWNKQMEQHSVRFYCTIAMLNAYFSMLEHLLVLIWPFCGYRPGLDDPRAFIFDKRIREKFKALFPAEAARDRSAYTALLDLAYRYRNTFDHGGFDREGATLHVAIPGAGFVPSAMSRFRGSVHFGLFPVEQADFEEVCRAVDAIDEFLDHGPAARAVKLVGAGFDIPFFEEGLRPMIEAVEASDEELDAFMTAEAERLDFLENMDW